MDEVEDIHYLSEIDPLNPIGTQFRQRLREGIMTRNYDGRVEVYEEYERFSVTFSDRRFQFRLDYFLEAFEGGTKLRYKLVNKKESLLTMLAGGWVAGMTEKMVVSHLRNLKAFAETQSNPH